MKFPNAYRGVKKIRLGQLFALIAALAAIAMVVFVAAKIDVNTEELGEDALGPIAILLLLSGIFAIIGMIITLVGIVNAMKDESAFRGALIFVILGLIVSAANSFYFGSNEKYEDITKYIDTGVKLLTLIASMCVVKGCMNLAQKLDRPDMVQKGRAAMTAIVIIYLIAIGCDLVRVLVAPEKLGDTILSVVEIAASVLMLIYLIVYIAYLGKAKKMLKE